MKKFALSKVRDDLSRFLRLAEAEEIVITRHGKPAAVLIGFKSEDDWFDYPTRERPSLPEPDGAGEGEHSRRTRSPAG